MNLSNEEVLFRASQGDAEAQAMMAEICFIRNDAKGALHWSELSANQQNARGLYALGMCYLKEYGIQRNLERAKKLFLESQSMGCKRALTGLASIYAFEGRPFCQEAIGLIKEAAESNDSKGLYLLAQLHVNGTGVIKSFLRYYELLTQSAIQGYVSAQYELAQVHLSEDLPMHNDEKGIGLLKECIDRGFTKAEAHLAYLYLVGQGVDKDEKKAFSMFSQAAEAGCPEAMRSVGFCYLNGDGVAADRDRAVQWFAKAFEAGLTDCEELAEIAKGGIDFIKDKLTDESTKEVFEYRDRVISDASNGDPDANFELGRFYLEGKVNEWMTFAKNISMARKHFTLAAEAGHIEAAYTMGGFDENGYGTDHQDLNAAMKWYSIAAEKGHSRSMVELARMFQTLGISEEAVRWLQKASDTGNAEAKGMLSLHYVYGVGIDKDENIAFSLARESAECSDREGQKMLGLCFLYGIGTNRDIENAVWWLTAAANQGEEVSMTLMGRLLMGEFEYSHIDYALAEQLLYAATHNGNANAAYYLGVFYYNIANDMEKAHETFQLATELGNEDAKNILREYFS